MRDTKFSAGLHIEMATPSLSLCQAKNRLLRAGQGLAFLLLLACMVCGSAQWTFAQPADTAEETPAAEQGESTAPAAPPQEEKKSDPRMQGLLERLRQPGDDVSPEKLDVTPSEAAENKRKSLALYMSGRDLEHDKKYQEAYDAFQQAIALNPESLSLYRALIPLAFRLQKTDEAITLARKAVELDPNNFELLSQLGIYALRQQDLQGSIDYFQKAVQSQTVDKKSGPYISIMGQLGQLYLSLGNREKAAESYEAVFKALSQPENYSLDYRTQQALESLRGSKTETYESLGELFLVTDRLELAAAAFNKAKEANRNNPAIFSYQLARVLAKQKENEAALAKLQEYFTAKLSQKGRGPYLLLAELLIALEREEEILSELKKLADADPENEALQLYLAERYVQADQLEAAEKIYQQYLTSKKSSGDVQLGLLQIYRKRQNAEQVLETLTQAMLQGANSDRLEAELELLAQEEKLSDEVIAAGLENEEGDDRKLFTQAYLLAKLAMQRKNHTAVVDFYERALEIQQERQLLLQLYSELVQYLISEEQLETCAAILEEAIDNPAVSPARQAFQLQLVRVLVMDKKFDKASAVVASARESDPDSLQWQYQEAWVQYSAENWEEAVKLFAPLLEKSLVQRNESMEKEIRYNLSRSLAFAGMTDEALQLIQQTIELEPEELLWKYQLGWVYYFTHQWDKAIEAYKSLVEQGEKSPNQALVRQAHFSLSAAYVQNEQFDEGEKILEVIYEKDPNDPSVCNDLGYLYADRDKKLDQALKMIEIALKAEPENKAYLDSMGWVLYRLGRYEEALEHLQKAVVDSEKGDAVLWDHLGDCYEKLQQQEKAREAWKNALEHEQAEKHANKKLIEQLQEKLK